MTDLFTQKAPAMMQRLMADFGLTTAQAAGILGNIGRECGGFKWMVELSGGGGLGMCQWTGSRRRTFEAWCKQHGYSTHSDEGNYTYLKHELQGSEAAAIKAVKKTKSVGEATAAFERVFERAGVVALNDRINWANKALAAYKAVHG